MCETWATHFYMKPMKLIHDTILPLSMLRQQAKNSIKFHMRFANRTEPISKLEIHIASHLLGLIMTRYEKSLPFEYIIPVLKAYKMWTSLLEWKC